MCLDSIGHVNVNVTRVHIICGQNIVKFSYKNGKLPNKNVCEIIVYATILTVSDYYADIIAHIGADIVKNIRQLICCPFCGISAWLSFR